MLSSTIAVPTCRDKRGIYAAYTYDSLNLLTDAREMVRTLALGNRHFCMKAPAAGTPKWQTPALWKVVHSQHGDEPVLICGHDKARKVTAGAKVK